MDELFKNASDIIKAASANPPALIISIIIVYAVLFAIYLNSRRDGKTTALFIILLLLPILLICIFYPRCWDGSRSNPCPPPPPPCWDGSRSNPCPPPPPPCWDGSRYNPCPPPPPPCWDGSRSNPCPPKPWIPTRDVGEDKQGRKATFDIYVLTNEYSWEVGTPSDTSPGKIKYNGKLEDLDFLKKLLQAEDMLRVLTSADVIISFGTASCEGGVGEENRALERASLIQTLIKEINKSRIKSPAYKKLNLGQFKSNNCGDPPSTESQRKIIVVGVDISNDKNDKNVDVKEALRNFLEILDSKQGRVGPFKMGDYSLFDYTS